MNRLAVQWIRICGGLILLLGLIHDAMTPVVMKELASELTASTALSFLFMFLAAGTALILTGLIVLYAAGGWKRGEGWAKVVTFLCSGFIMLMGIGAALTMPDNPFAWIILVLAIVFLIPHLMFRGTIKSRGSAE